MKLLLQSIDVATASVIIALLGFIYLIVPKKKEKKPNEKKLDLIISGIDYLKKDLKNITELLEIADNLQRIHTAQANREHKVIRKWQILFQDLMETVESTNKVVNGLKNDTKSEKFQKYEKEILEDLSFKIARIKKEFEDLKK